MSENGEINTGGKNFTLPPTVTAMTNVTSDCRALFLNEKIWLSFSKTLYCILINFVCWLVAVQKTVLILFAGWRNNFWLKFGKSDFSRGKVIFFGLVQINWFDERLEKHMVYLYLFSHNNFASTNCTLIILFSGTTTKKNSKRKGMA